MVTIPGVASIRVLVIHDEGTDWPVPLQSDEDLDLAFTSMHALDHSADGLAKPDVVLVNIEGNLRQRIGRISTRFPGAAMLVFLTQDDPALTHWLLHNGASDCIMRDECSGKLLRRAIRYTLERTALQADLLERQQQLHQVIENNADAIVVIDAEGRVLLMNAACARLLERQRSDVVGQAFGIPIVNAQTAEVQLRRSDGSTIIAEMRVTRMSWHRQPAWLATLRDISDRVQAEDARRAADERFRRAVQHAPLPIMLHLDDGAVLAVNHAWQAQAGYSATDLPRVADWIDAMALPAEDSPPRTLPSGEVPVRTRYATLRYWDFHAASLGALSDGRELSVVMANDVTARHHAQQARRDAQERLHLALEGGDLGLWDWHIPSGKAIFNERWASMIGDDVKQIEQHIDSWTERIHPDDREATWGAVNAHLRGETDRYETEHRIRTAQGDYRWVLDRGRVVERDAHGQPVRMVGTHADVTERRYVLDRLALVDQAIKASPTGVSIADADQPDMPLIYVNPAFERITGYAWQDVVGTNCRFLQADDRDQDAIAEIRQSIQAQRPCRVVLRNYRKDGTLFWNELRLAPVLDAYGKLTHYVGIQNDITEQVQAREALEAAHASLDRRNHRLAALYAVGRTISETLEPEQIYDTLYREVANGLFHTHQMAINLVNDAGDSVRCVYLMTNDSRVPEDHLPGATPLKGGPNTEAIRTRQPALVNVDAIRRPLEQENRFVTVTGAVIPRSAMIAPMVAHGRVLGTINLHHFEPDAFTQDDLDLLGSIANQAAVALHNAQLYQAIKQQARAIARLDSATSAILSANNLMELSEQIVNGIVREFDHADCGLVLREADSPILLRVRRAGQFQVRATHSMIIDGRGLVPEAVRTHQIVYAPDVEQHPAYVIGDPRTRCELVVPLMAEGEVIGALDLQSETPDAFDADDRRALLAFAERAAAKIRIVQLYEKLDEHAADLEWRVAQRTAQLKNTKDHVETVLNHISDAVAVLDNKGRFQQVNPAFERWFDVSGDALLMQPFETVITREERETAAGIVRDALTGQERRVELHARRPGGAFVVDAEFTPIIPQDDETRKEVVVSLRDMSSVKELEASLREALNRERELGEMKARFSSMVSHELRTPLAVILSSASMLRSYFDRLSPERRNKKLEGIIEQTHHLDRMVNDMLFISRANDKPVAFKPDTSDVVGLIQTVLHDVKTARATRHEIAFSHQLDGAQVKVDGGLLRHILSNLVSNAIKYSPEDRPITVRAETAGTSLVLSVRDRGIGIPEVQQRHLFEPFFRAENVGNISGTGLGLMIVKLATDAHGGSISFNSAEGAGTTFTVTLPGQPPDTPDDAPGDAPAHD